MGQFVLIEQRLNPGALGRRHVGDDQVLIRGQAEVAVVHLRDLAQAGSHRGFVGVGDAAVLDEQRQVAVAVLVVDPAVAVAVVVERKRPRLAKRVAEPVFDFAAKPVQAAILDRVLESRVSAVNAVAEVALRGDDFLGDIGHLPRRAKAEHIRQAREGCLLAVAHPHAAAGGDCVADDSVVLDDGDEAEVVREHIDVVARRDGDDNLEFARQVSLAVDRLGFRLGTWRHVFLLAVFVGQPNLVVRPRRRREVGADRLGHLQHLGVQLGLVRVRVAHHVAVHVAARRDRVHQRVVDFPDGRLEIFLDDAVQLERLARGELERAVGVVGAEAIHVQPLLRRANPAGHAHARHERKGPFLLGLAPLPPQIAIVLLIDAVELSQLRVVRGQRAGGVVPQPVGDGAPEEIAVGLDGFVLGQLWLVGGFVWVGHLSVTSRIGERRS